MFPLFAFAQPTITKLDPKTGPSTGEGTYLINGTNFGNNIDNVKVFYGSAQVAASSIVSVTPTLITLNGIPPSPTNGNAISTVAVKVQVRNQTSPNNPPTNEFTYVPVPQVENFVPFFTGFSNSNAGNNLLSFFGNWLDTSPITVKIGGVKAQIISRSMTVVTVLIPQNVSTTGPVQVQFKNTFGSFQAKGIFTIRNPVAYYDMSAFVITTMGQIYHLNGTVGASNPLQTKRLINVGAFLQVGNTVFLSAGTDMNITLGSEAVQPTPAPPPPYALFIGTFTNPGSSTAVFSIAGYITPASVVDSFPDSGTTSFFFLDMESRDFPSGVHFTMGGSSLTVKKEAGR